MAEFTDEIDLIADMNKDIDVLFGGIRGCSLGEPEQVKQGLYYTLNKLQPKLFIPMHAGGHTFAYKEFVETAERAGCANFSGRANFGRFFSEPCSGTLKSGFHF